MVGPLIVKLRGLKVTVQFQISKNIYGICYKFPSIIGAVVWAEPTSQWIGAQFESVGLVWWVI